jgi:hypothetical protein
MQENLASSGPSVRLMPALVFPASTGSERIIDRASHVQESEIAITSVLGNKRKKP